MPKSRAPKLSDSLLKKKPKLAKQWSSNNSIKASDVYPSSNSKFYFKCSFCLIDVFISPGKLKNDYVVACNDRDCAAAQKKEISKRKMLKKVSAQGSLRDYSDEIAETWLYQKDGYTADTVTKQATTLVKWKCKKIDYHIWEQRVDRRVNHPNCPFCTGQRVHIDDSLYSWLEKNEQLSQLHESNHEDAKRLSKGSTSEKLTWICRYCQSPFKAAAYTKTSIQDGCNNCKGKRVTETSREKEIASNGSLSSKAPNLVEQYCFDQIGIEPDKINPLGPSEINANSTATVWWRCKNGHYTTAPVYKRVRGSKCSRCVPKVSGIQLRFYSELSAILRDHTVSLCKLLDNSEADICIDGINVAIEIDGKRWHENRIKEDTKKNKQFSDLNYKVIRIREELLDDLDFTDLTLNYPYKYKPKHIKKIVLKIIKYLNRDSYLENPSKYLDTDTFLGGLIFSECSEKYDTVEYMQSVAFNCSSHLVNEFSDENDFSLDNVTMGSTRNAIWKCNSCKYEWSTSIAKRTGGPKKKNGTGCPACAGQVVWENNSLKALFPKVSKWFSDKNDKSSEDVTPGSGYKALFECPKDDCKESHKISVKDKVRQFQRNGTCCTQDCRKGKN